MQVAPCNTGVTIFSIPIVLLSLCACDIKLCFLEWKKFTISDILETQYFIDILVGNTASIFLLLFCFFIYFQQGVKYIHIGSFEMINTSQEPLGNICKHFDALFYLQEREVDKWRLYNVGACI